MAHLVTSRTGGHTTGEGSAVRTLHGGRRAWRRRGYGRGGAGDRIARATAAGEGRVARLSCSVSVVSALLCACGTVRVNKLRAPPSPDCDWTADSHLPSPARHRPHLSRTKKYDTSDPYWVQIICGTRNRHNHQSCANIRILSFAHPQVRSMHEERSGMRMRMRAFDQPLHMPERTSRPSEVRRGPPDG